MSPSEATGEDRLDANEPPDRTAARDCANAVLVNPAALVIGRIGRGKALPPGGTR